RRGPVRHRPVGDDVPAAAEVVLELADLIVPERRSHRARWVAAAVGVPIALLVAVLATRPPAGTRAADSPLLGKPAPAINATTIDGQPVELARAQGRWVLLNFFATWCVPCRREHPDLVRFAQQHQSEGDLDVLG